MSEHRRTRDLLGPYVLNSLEPEEEMMVREHIARCEDCRTEEQSLRYSHERLSDLASVAETPPPELKDRVLARLPRRETRRTSLLLAAAAICVLAALGALFGSDLLTRDAASIALQPTEFAPQAGGELRVQAEDSNLEAELEVWDLPHPTQNEYYELWFGKGEGRVSAGTFTVDNKGRGKLSMNVPRTTGDYQRVGITLEEFPEEPSMDSPTVVLGGELDES